MLRAKGFTLVEVAVLLAMVGIVASCGGGGGGGGGGAAPVTFSTSSKLFAADQSNGQVGHTPSSGPSPGATVTLDRIISGPATQLPMGCVSCIPSMALDSSRDLLYVSTSNNVLVFSNAGTSGGNFPPARVIAAASGSGQFIQLNANENRLYISTPQGTIDVVDGASTADTSNAAAHVLILNQFTTATDLIIGLALDATHNVLYVGLSRSGAASVGLIANINTKLDGHQNLDAEFAVNGSINTSIAVDGTKNRLYVANSAGQISVFDSASTLTAGAMPARTIAITPATQYKLFVESVNDRLYAAADNRVAIVSNASTATGSPTVAQALLPTTNSDLSAVVASP